MNLSDFFEDHGWAQIAQLEIPGREARLGQLSRELVCPHTAFFSKKLHPDGLYLHQVEAIHRFSQGANVCLATGTSSGKTTLFHCAAIEVFSKDPAARIVCLYPLKALANEQEERWASAMGQGVKNCQVGRISGDVPVAAREQILRRCQVVAMTPDVMHAWLLPNADKSAVKRFLQHLKLVIVDEAHAYTGVFGSNCGFLFRRLRHLCCEVKNRPRFIAASATIANPKEHLRLLTGCEFDVIGEECNGAKRYPIAIRLLYPPSGDDLLSSLAVFLKFLTESEDRRVIAFADSRKQVELLTSIAIRGQHEEQPDEESAGAVDADFGYREIEDSLSFLKRLSILPYRSGYEEEDRRLIQRRLSEGSLKGVISTSALELGIDIPHLDTAVLVGVPPSSTNFWQRIGRVGRRKPGEVFVVNRGSIYDEAVFGAPQTLLERPPAEGALYLNNPRIQYIHALCLARLGGEHDKIVDRVSEDLDFKLNVEFPEGFKELCEMERTGQVPVELQSMKNESGDNPNHSFPLRDVESSFKVTVRNGPEEYNLGSLTYSQCLREAYPGAVYRYATRAYRVYQVNLRSKEIKVRHEKNFVTKPSFLPTLVFPNMSAGNVFQKVDVGDLTLVECNLQIREWLNGFAERRGSSEFTVTYPHINERACFSYPHSSFFRNYFTSGLVILHPSMMVEGVNRELLANLLLESLLLTVAFDRNDVRPASDKLRVKWNQYLEGTRFVSLYDSTYGSLHLSGRLLDEDVLRECLLKLGRLAEQPEVDQATRSAATSLAGLASAPLQRSSPSSDSVCSRNIDSDHEVILPGSFGVHLTNNNELYFVEGVYWNPKENCLFYRGKLQSMLGPDDHLLTPVDRVKPIFGESKLGIYDVETGEVRSI